MKKKIKKVVFTLLFLTGGISVVFLAYLHFFASDDKDLSGEWTADLDMTEQAAIAAFSWLQDIEGVSVSLEEMEDCMQGLTVQVNLTFEPTSRREGTFHCMVVQESYDACTQAAYGAFAAAFWELLAERLAMAGYTGSMDEEAIEALVTETFGMPTDAYLMSYGPELLPPLEELQAHYDGSGTYKTTEDILTRQFDGGGAAVTREEYYIRKDSSLLLSEGTEDDGSGLSLAQDLVLYTLQQPAN